jgi:hypothetical protein
MDLLPDEMWVKILKYIYNDKDENYRIIYQLNLPNLNCVCKKMNYIISNYKNMIIPQKGSIKCRGERIIHILNSRLDFIPNNKLQINKYIKYKNDIAIFIKKCIKYF